MDNNSANSAPTTDPYKQKEFKAFIETIKGGAIGHWVQIAKALGVNKDTITAWKVLPEAQKAIEEGIQDAIDKMEIAGSGDWRMWESKLKMLNISPIEKSDVTTDGEPLPSPIYGSKSTE